MYKQLSEQLMKEPKPQKQATGHIIQQGISFEKNWIHHIVCAYQMCRLARQQNMGELTDIVDHYIFDLLDWARVYWKGFNENQKVDSCHEHDSPEGSLPRTLKELEKIVEKMHVGSATEEEFKKYIYPNATESESNVTS